MKIYNKTKTVRTYGNDRFSLELPASATEGVRGQEVVVSDKQKLAIHLDYKEFVADFQAGHIEIVE